MVEQAHVDQIQRIAQAAGKHNIGFRRLGAAAGMVVRDNQRAGVHFQRLLHHLAHIHGVFRHRAAPQLALADQPVALVEKQRQRYLHFFMPQLQAQKIGHRLRVFEADIVLQLFAEHTPADFAHHRKLGVARRPHAFMCRQGLHIGAHQPAQAAEFAQQMARQIHRAHAPRAHAQQNRQQFGIAQRCRAAFDQLFTRALALGPLLDAHYVSPFIIDNE